MHYDQPGNSALLNVFCSPFHLNSKQQTIMSVTCSISTCLVLEFSEGQWEYVLLHSDLVLFVCSFF